MAVRLHAARRLFAMPQSQPGLAPLARFRTTLLVWLAALPLLWLSLVAAPELRVDVGEWGDHALITGVNPPELSSTESNRWTTDTATLSFPLVSPAYHVLAMRLHGWRPQGSPPVVTLSVDGRPWGQFATATAPRVYRLILPEQQAAATRIGLTVPHYQPPGDERVIGIALDWAALRRVGARWAVGWLQFGGQAALLALVLALITLLAPARGWHAVACVLAAAALLALNLAQPLWVSLALPAWLLLAGALFGAEWALGSRARAWLQPWMGPHVARAAWIVLLAALAVRLAGATHPFFDAHDLPVHDRWMRSIAAGQLYLYSTPGELQNRLTFNPPAGYLLLLPLWLLLHDLRITIQAGTAWLDALGCLALLPIARHLRLSGRAALFALALYAALPINLTMLWWGFATNDIAQTLWLVLLWAILRLEHDQSRRSLALVAVAAAACVLTHIGALVLVAAMLALIAIGGCWALPRRSWLALAGGLALAAAGTLPIYFAAAAMPVLTQPADPDARTLAESLARGLSMLALRLEFVRRAYALGYTPILLAALPAGLALWWAAPRRHALQRLLLAGLAASSALFAAVSGLLGFLTR